LKRGLYRGLQEGVSTGHVAGMLQFVGGAIRLLPFGPEVSCGAGSERNGKRNGYRPESVAFH